MVDQIPAVKPEDQKTAAEALDKKFNSSWRFKDSIKAALLNTIIKKRFNDENKENLAALFLREQCSGEDENGEWQEIDPDYRGIVNDIFGNINSFNEIPITPQTQRIFFFLIATGIRTNSMPDLNDSDEDWERTEQSMFWKFAQIDKELYLQMYREVLDKAVKGVMSEQGHAKEENTEGIDEDDGYDE
jgi:hypothetical protein